MQWCCTIKTLFHIFYDLFISSFDCFNCMRLFRFEQLFSITVYRKNEANESMSLKFSHARWIASHSNRVVAFRTFMLLILTNIICIIMQSDRHKELCDMFARTTLHFFLIRWHFLFSLFLIYMMIDSTRIQTIAERVSQYRKLLNLTFRLLLSATCSRLLA